MDADERRAAVFYGILEFMDEMGFSHVDPYVILSQSALETSFTSNRIVNDNNAFGMRMPHQRETTAIGERDGFAVYASLRDSVKDYFLRQQVFNIPNTADAAEYICATVASGYAVEAPYAQAWTDIYVDDSVAWEIMLDPINVVADGPKEAGASSMALLGLVAVGLLASKR